MIVLADQTKGKLVRSNSAKRIADMAHAKLEQNPHFRGRSDLISITAHQGRLVLRGRLPTYHLKQVLQTVLRDVDGVRQIDNRVSVDWPPAS